MDVRISRVAIAVISTASICLSVTARAESDVIKLGFSGPMTGAQAQYGEDYLSGVQLAVDQFNASKPKIDGRAVTFALDVGDDQADPKTGTLVAQKLVDDQIKGMIGHFNSGVTIPASAIYSKAGIPEVSVSTSPVYTHQGFKTTFRVITSDSQQGGAMGQYVVHKLGAKRIAIIDDRTAYGQGLAEEFEKSVKASGGNVVDHQFTDDKSVDFKAILTNLKSENPDLVYYAGVEAQSAPMVKQMRALLMKATFVSCEASKSEDFIEAAGPAAEGVVVSLAGVPLDKMPGGKKFSENYRRKFGKAPTTYAPYSYDGATAIMKSMTTANSSDPNVYLPVLAKIDMRGVTTPHFAFDQYGNLRGDAITVYRVDGGQWKTIQVIGSQ